MNFSNALEAVKLGKKITRKGWNGKGLWIELQTPDANSKMTLPYLFLVYPRKSTTAGITIPGTEQRVPWLASQTDLLSEDWEVIAEFTLPEKTSHEPFAFRSTRDPNRIVYREYPTGANAAFKRAPEMDKVKQ